MRSNLESRLVSLEARQPPVKSDTQKFLEKLTDDELNQLEKIAKKNESGREPTQDEYAFLNELEAKYEFVQRLGKRVADLEARQAPSYAFGDRWPPQDCDPNRRLARYKAYFEGRLWDCTETSCAKGFQGDQAGMLRGVFRSVSGWCAIPQEGGMKADSLNRRLKDLEREQAEPVKFKLLWYDKEQDSHEPGAEIIKLRWLDEVEKEY